MYLSSIYGFHKCWSMYMEWHPCAWTWSGMITSIGNYVGATCNCDGIIIHIIMCISIVTSIALAMVP